MEEANERNWSSLPTDIVFLIKSLLIGRDRVIFNCVCKAWKSVPTTALPSSAASIIHLIDLPNSFSKMIQFPLLMFIARDDSVCNFYHAIHNTTYTLEVPEVANARIRYAKDGWLLMSRPDKEIFFFNPITEERIELPPIPYACYCYASIGFSSIPTSPDCVVLAINDSYYNRTAKLSYIRKGEDSWTNRDLRQDKRVDFVASYCNPIFYKGIFYCLGMEGNLVKFDPNEEDDENAWSVLSRPKKPCTSSRRSYFIESLGELLCVFEGHAGEFIEIFKLDQPSMSWKKVTSLGLNTLFASLTSSFSATCKETQVLGLTNTIFFPRFKDKQHLLFYSHATSKFHSLTLDNFSSKDFYGTGEKLHCCWIQPNFVNHLEEELKWFLE